MRYRLAFGLRLYVERPTVWTGRTAQKVGLVQLARSLAGKPPFSGAVVGKPVHQLGKRDAAVVVASWALTHGRLPSIFFRIFVHGGLGINLRTWDGNPRATHSTATRTTSAASVSRISRTRVQRSHRESFTTWRQSAVTLPLRWDRWRHAEWRTTGPGPLLSPGYGATPPGGDPAFRRRRV